jgi:PAS domain S-box-containing protein
LKTDLEDFLMSRNPTYDELKQRVDELEKDDTKRKRFEKALLESEEKHRFLIKNLPSIVYKGYKDWSVEFFDRKIELLTGYDVDEYNSGKIKWYDIIVKEDLETARESFIRALKTDKSYVREYRIKSKAGKIHWIQERGQAGSGFK